MSIDLYILTRNPCGVSAESSLSFPPFSSRDRICGRKPFPKNQVVACFVPHRRGSSRATKQAAALLVFLSRMQPAPITRTTRSISNLSGFAPVDISEHLALFSSTSTSLSQLLNATIASTVFLPHYSNLWGRQQRVATCVASHIVAWHSKAPTKQPPSATDPPYVRFSLISKIDVEKYNIYGGTALTYHTSLLN
jgi:hypothetical protein